MKHKKPYSKQRNNYHGNRNKNRQNNNSQGNNGNNNNKFRENNRIESMLPSPTVFQEYEYASEGLAKRLVEMAEIEQDSRHDWEEDYMRFHKKSVRFGQLFGFIIVIAVILATVSLANNGHEDVAKTLAASAFLSMAVANLFAIFGRKLARKPRRRD